MSTINITLKALFKFTFWISRPLRVLLGSSEQQMRMLFPDINQAQARKLAQLITERRVANSVLKRTILVFGHRNLKDYIKIKGARHLYDILDQGVPVVLAPWHFGPVNAIGTAMAKMNTHVLVLQKWPRKTQTPGIEYLHFEGSSSTRVQALKYGVEQLRSGGVVMTVVDVPTTQALEGAGPYSLLGRRVFLLQGAATLARMGKAAIVPVSARWQDHQPVIEFAQPIVMPEPSLTETEIQTALAAWWDTEISARPEELWPLSVQAIIGAPPIKAES